MHTIDQCSSSKLECLSKGTKGLQQLFFVVVAVGFFFSASFPSREISGDPGTCKYNIVYLLIIGNEDIYSTNSLVYRQSYN